MSSKSAKRARQRARRHESRKHTGKRAYATLEEAEAVAATVARKGQVVQTYECEYGDDGPHFHNGGHHHGPLY